MDIVHDDDGSHLIFMLIAGSLLLLVIGLSIWLVGRSVYKSMNLKRLMKSKGRTRDYHKIRKFMRNVMRRETDVEKSLKQPLLDIS